MEDPGLHTSPTASTTGQVTGMYTAPVPSNVCNDKACGGCNNSLLVFYYRGVQVPPCCTTFIFFAEES